MIGGASLAHLSMAQRSLKSIGREYDGCIRDHPVQLYGRIARESSRVVRDLRHNADYRSAVLVLGIRESGRRARAEQGMSAWLRNGDLLARHEMLAASQYDLVELVLARVVREVWGYASTNV